MAERVMKVGPDWKPLGVAFALLSVFFVLAAIFGSGRGAALYQSAARAVPIEFPSEAPNIPETAYSDELTAMEWTAWAAFASTLLAFTTLMILLATLIVTKRTLDQARETTRAAWETAAVTRKVGENQSRAYAWVEAIQVCFPSAPDELLTLLTAARPSPMIRVLLQIRNDGTTPAIQISASALLQIKSSSGNAFSPIKLEYEKSTEAPSRERVLAKETTRNLILSIPAARATLENAFAPAPDVETEILGNSLSYEISGHIQYDDVYGHSYHSSFRCFGPVTYDARYYQSMMLDEPEALFQRIRRTSKISDR